MNIRQLSDNDMADVAKRVLDLLTGTELDAIDSQLRAELVAAFGTLPADLDAQTAAAADIDSQKVAATSLKNSTRFKIQGVMSRVQNALKTGLAPKEQFDMCSLNYPATRVKVYIAQDPTELSAVGFSNGVNKGKFRGNNTGSSIVYEVWRREGDEGPWMKHLLTRKQSFTDTGVTPGQYYEYKVRALAAQTESQYSNSAVVYGVL